MTDPAKPSLCAAISIGLAEHLANPSEAARKAEEAGYVHVKDTRGVTRLVICSNRATEQLLGDE